jgi:hypothetical protein
LRTLWLFLSLGLSLFLAAFAYADCPPEGDAKQADDKAQNVFKNRDADSRGSVVPTITLDDILTNENACDPALAASITGYVVEVKRGGEETANCHATEADEQDTHIALAVNQDDPKSKWVIVEVTPRSRKAFGLGSTDKLHDEIMGKQVTVTGWLFFDQVHADEASLTAKPDATFIWRGTACEIHPVQSIVVLNQ